MATKPAPSFPRLVLVLATLALAIFCLNQAQKILIPLALALLIAFILTPVVDILERRGVKRVLAVVLSVLLAFALMGVIGWAIVLELSNLAGDMPRHTDAIIQKIETLRGNGPSVIDQLQHTGLEISKAVQNLLQRTGEKHDKPPQEVKVISSDFAWFPQVLGPFVEFLASAFLVLILVIFMLVMREDLRNRLIRLVGRGRLTVTTRAMDEAAQRISRYLLMQVTINVGFGALVSLGLFIIAGIFNPSDVPSYALLWGFLAGLLRFVPYVGIWAAAVLPVAYTAAVAPGWIEPMVVFTFFLALELVTANIVEPLLFGHSTGISPVALLIAVAFWAWLWGPIGLLLATPLTSCLLVLGKYVPQLEFLDVLLGTEPSLEPEVKYYQRLLARDQDEATDLVEDYMKTNPVDAVYDRMLLKALLMAKRDRERDELTPDDEQFIHKVTRDILEDLVLPQQHFSLLATKAIPSDAANRPPPTKVVILGCPAQDETDELALEMLRQLLAPGGCDVDIGSVKMLSSEVLAWVKEKNATMICVVSLPPGGLAQARYLCKRLHATCPDVKVMVGRWGQVENVERTQERLRAAGADYVGTSLLETRSQIIPLRGLSPSPPPAPASTASPQPASREQAMNTSVGRVDSNRQQKQ